MPYSIGHNLRISVRRLRRDPLFSVLAIFCLALAIGANTAVFSVLKAVVLAPLPFPDADHLQTTPTIFTGANRDDQEYLATPDAYAEMRQARSFTSLAAIWEGEMDLTEEGAEPERVRAAWVTPDLFRLLGTRPLLGRTLQAGDERPGSGDPAVIDEGLWRRRYGADPGLVGRAILVDGRPRTVVGVIPSRAGYPLAAELWTPFDPDTMSGGLRRMGFLMTVGRLADGADPGAAQEEMDAVAARLADLTAGRSVAGRW